MGKILCALHALRIIQRLEKSETIINFSWPVTIPFYIMHIDIWLPGTELHKNQEVFHLIKSICDLTQLITSSITTDTKT